MGNIFAKPSYDVLHSATPFQFLSKISLTRWRFSRLNDDDDSLYCEHLPRMEPSAHIESTVEQATTHRSWTCRKRKGKVPREERQRPLNEIFRRTRSEQTLQSYYSHDSEHSVPRELNERTNHGLEEESIDISEVVRRLWEYEREQSENNSSQNNQISRHDQIPTEETRLRTRSSASAPQIEIPNVFADASAPYARDELVLITSLPDHLVRPSVFPTRECSICTSTLPVHRFPTQPPTSACSHESSTCRHCLRTWLRTCIDTRLWDQITCPECAAQLQYEEVRKCAERKVFERYDVLAARAAMEDIEGFQWCAVMMDRGKKAGKGKDGNRSKQAVVGGCGSGQIVGDGDAKMGCVGCGSVQCVRHRVVWHKGETCQE